MPSERTIAVAGEATELVTPDRCTVAFSLHAPRDSAGEAIAAVSELANEAVGALREHGVAPSELRTHNVMLQDWLDEPGRGRRVVGRVATYAFSVRQVGLRDAGNVISVLTEVAGDALKINGIGMTVGDPSSALAIARRNAVLDARSRAQQLADASGVRLGRVLSIEEGVARARVETGRAVAVSAGPPLPIEPGSEGVHARVVVAFEIADD